MPSFLSQTAPLLLASFAAASAFFFALPARADDAAIPLRVVVAENATEVCPNAEAFLAEVRAVEPKVRPNDATSAPLAEIAFRARSNGGFRGELRFDDRNGGALTRTAEGNDCADVARALAIVTALQASETASARPPAATSSEPVEVVALRTDDRPTATAGTQSASRVAAHEVFAGAGFRSGILAGLSPFADVGYALHAKSTSGRPIVLRAGLVFGQDTSDLTVSRLIAGFLDACPFGFGSLATVNLSMCMRSEFGAKVVGARSRGTSQLAPWSSLGASATLSVHLVRGLTVELDAAALEPLVRTRFTVGSSDFGGDLGRVESVVPLVVLTAGLGLGWSFFTDFGARR